MDLWIVAAWGLKNEEVFQIELVDNPAWSLKNKEAFCSGSAPCRALTTVECPKSEPSDLSTFFDIMLLFALVERVNISPMKDFVY